MTTNRFLETGRRLGQVFVVGAAMLLTACGGSGSPPASQPAAAITAQPTDQAAVAGTAATFTVVATNATGYQWQRSGDGGATFADVAGAGSPSHTTAVVTPADSGTQYRVVVAGGADRVTSSAATLTVAAAAAAPAISMQPASLAVAAGQDASFSVTATGTALAYQWQRRTGSGLPFADEPGANGATLNLAAVPLVQDGHLFRVVVSNIAGSVTSSAALLTVGSPTRDGPVFTIQPLSVSVAEGQSARFSVAVTGTPAPALEWQASVDNGPWSGFGSTTPVYTINSAGAADSGRRYRVVATNSAGSATSDAALLTVTAAPAAPVFTVQPASVTITAGQSTRFEVAASGSPSPALQWQLSTDGGSNWGNIVGATGTIFNVVGAAQGNDGRQFRAVATNSAGSATSAPAILTVNAAAKSWQPAVRVGAAIGGDSYEPQVAFDAAGNAIAVWQHVAAGGNRYDIWANRYLAASGWGTPRLIEFDDSGTANVPRLGVDAAGNAVAVWEQLTPGGTDWRIVANTFTPAGGWGAAMNISGAGNPANAPQVAMSANGVALVAWSELVAFSPRILTARYAAGSWTTPTELDAGNTGGYKVAMNASGDGMAAWLKYDGTRFNVVAAACPGAVCGGWLPIETDSSGDAGEISLAVNDSGTAVAVWQQQVSSRYDIWSNRYVPGSGWGTAGLIEDDDRLGHAAAGNPQVGLDNSGNAAAVWTLNTGNFIGIYANSQPAGAGWGTASQIKSGVTGFRFGINGAGDVLGIWQQGSLLYANDVYVTAPSGWSVSASPVSTTNVGGPPRLALDANGNAMAVWMQPDGGANVVWASVYK